MHIVDLRWPVYKLVADGKALVNLFIYLDKTGKLWYNFNV